MKTVLLSTAYLPPISYLAECISADTVVIEAHDHFIKQTYRNRSAIYGANGKLELIIPVNHSDLYIKPISQVATSSTYNWQRNHWRSIESAYRNAAFFEYYEQEFKGPFLQPAENLFNWNLNLLQTILRLLKKEVTLEISTSYNAEVSSDIIDLRNSFKPKQKTGENLMEYFQVFGQKYGFISNLSSLDLLFNVGNNSLDYLRKMKTATNSLES